MLVRAGWATYVAGNSDRLDAKPAVHDDEQSCKTANLSHAVGHPLLATLDVAHAAASVSPGYKAPSSAMLWYGAERALPMKPEVEGTEETH